jgi:hypothetical protein
MIKRPDLLVFCADPGFSSFTGRLAFSMLFFFPFFSIRYGKVKNYSSYQIVSQLKDVFHVIFGKNMMKGILWQPTGLGEEQKSRRRSKKSEDGI